MRNARIHVEAGLGEGVRVIEQKKDTGNAIRVAAYCRVSTDMEVQESSLEIQMMAYEKIINDHPGWVLAGIYADKGISGTSTKHRDEFNRMMKDARDGKIQYILAKSISRFSRNTVDTLEYVRELKRLGVGVYFEKEGLDTGGTMYEFMLTIFAAAAEDEIRSLSENMKLGRRMRFTAGVTQWCNLYGFRKGENGEWLIEESEAEIVRRIFREYVEGRGVSEIAAGLQADGIPNTKGTEKWYAKSVSDILHNEKYAGDILMQKTFISDPIEHTKIKNKGAKVRQFRKDDHHAAIIDKETYNIAQTILAMQNRHGGNMQYPYYGFLKCPICGANMIRFLTPRNTHLYGWTCGGQDRGKGDLRSQRADCPPYFIGESYLDEGFFRAATEIPRETLETLKTGENPDLAAQASKILELRFRARLKNKKVEYKTLHDLVESITFPMWNVMRVKWKLGMTSEVMITYKKASDEPYPQIKKEKMERNTVRGSVVKDTYVVNGKPLIKWSPEFQIAGIRRMQEEIQNLIIRDPKPYEANVPHVYGKGTTSIDAGTETAEANRDRREEYKRRRVVSREMSASKPARHDAQEEND